MKTPALLITLLFSISSQVSAQDPKDLDLANNPKLFLKGASKAKKWTEPAEPTKIVGPIHFVGTKGLCVWLITTSDGHILLNTGMPGSGPMIEDSVRKLGFKVEDIKLLLTCHAHIDHVGGHAHIKKATGAKVVMMREGVELLGNGGKTDFHYGAIPEFGFDPVKTDRTIADDAGSLNPPLATSVVVLSMRYDGPPKLSIWYRMTSAPHTGNAAKTMNAAPMCRRHRVIDPK